MPKVSIVVPVYNVEKYISKCIESLVNQTLDDIEIIIINDGSTDNSETIIEKYVSQYGDKIKYFYKSNGGLSDARNYGMRYATGNYIAFLDSDDYVERTTYEKLYKKAIEENCDFVECNFIWKYNNKEVYDCGYVYKNKHEMFVNARVVAWNKLIRRSLVEKANVKFPKGLRYEDVEFFYKLLPYIEKFGFVKDNLIYYTQRDNSIVNTYNKKVEDIFIILDNVIEYYKKQNLFEQYKIELEYTYTRFLLCSSFLRIIKINEKKTRNELLDLTWSKLNETFPKWSSNEILKECKTKKNIYIKSINRITFKLYANICGIYFRFKNFIFK